MCAQFLIKIRVQDLMRNFDLKQAPEDLEDEISSRVLPRGKSLVVRANSANEPELREMMFSLLPSWSKEPKVKFATHNARIETVLEKPTWKKPFLYKRCLVPMSSFIEPIYEGNLANNMVAFSEKENHLLVACGIYDEWVNKDTGEVIESFSILTTEPPKFVAEVGHDRCPIFLVQNKYREWLDSNQHDGLKLMNVISTGTQEVDFKTDIDRPLKARKK